jgi:predicted AlkP superfamily phosphohydrolase/phosphomutase
VYTLIVGLDAFDPVLFERLSARGRLPHLTRHADSGRYARFAVTNPPQSEVSWTSIATGLNPGGHGIFDFVHRHPATYGLTVSLLPTRRGLGGTQFAPPSTAHTMFDHAVQQGFPATVLWWPATFPARPGSPVRTLPGLGTPDLHGRLGVGTLFVSDAASPEHRGKTPVVVLNRHGRERYAGRLNGPSRQTRHGAQESVMDLHLELTDERSARLTLGKHSLELVEGVWSPILEISFKMGPLLSVPALTRVLLRARPSVQLYVLPLQIHPLRSPWPYGTPPSFVRQTWKACGPFLTLGWPQDTTGLEDGCITDEQFADLCASVFHGRERVLMHHLDQFREGILASVFDCLDRIQHMFRRDRPDIVEEWYGTVDALIGRVEQRLADQGKRPKIIIVSDHGFTDFNYKVHLNRWLIERGYLVAQRDGGTGGLQDSDWSRSQAYAVGLNSVYLNLVGREGKGCVPVAGVEALTGRLRDELLAWRGPDGRPVIQHVWRREEVFEGPLAAHGPDLVIGFSPGYRASAETGLGKWEERSLENNRDHWGGDHCIDPRAVPGVLFSTHDLKELPHPSYHDIPVLATGSAPPPGGSAPPPAYTDEDEKVVEERLKSLGYL